MTYVLTRYLLRNDAKAMAMIAEKWPTYSRVQYPFKVAPLEALL
jgi:hypothetical protein